MISGQLVRVTTRRSFKLAIVVDASVRMATNQTTRVRISIWSANSSTWTKPVLVRRDQITALAYGVHSSRIKRVIDAAMAKVTGSNGWVHYKDGGTCVGEVKIL